MKDSNTDLILHQVLSVRDINKNEDKLQVQQPAKDSIFRRITKILKVTPKRKYEIDESDEEQKVHQYL